MLGVFSAPLPPPMLTSQNPDPTASRPFVLLRPLIAAWHWFFPPTQAHIDRQSRTARIAAGSLILLVAIGLMVFTVLNARNWHDGFQTWQSNRLINEAIKLKEQDKFVDAWLKAHEAYAKDADNVRVLRVMAQFYTYMQKKEAGWFFDRLRQKGAMTDEDTTFEIEALASIAENKQAQDQIEQVLKTSKPTQKVVELADVVLRKNQRSRQLLQILDTFVAQEPDNMEIKLLYGRRLVEFGTSDEIEKGLKLLWELASDKGANGLIALEFLDRVKTISSEEKQKLIELLDSHPQVKEEHRIAALRRQVELEPTRKQEIIAKAMEDRRGSKREDLVPLARWLTTEGENEKLLSYLDADMVRDYPPLLENYLNALTLLGRNEELAALINDPRTRLTTAIRAFHKAHLAYVTKESWERVNELLKEALAAIQSEGRQPMLLTIADYAEKRDHMKVAEEAYKLASRSNRADLAGYEGLLRLTYRNGNTAGFLAAAQETVQRWPEKEVFEERYLYSALISGVDMEQSIGRASRLLSSRPADSMRKLIVALGEIRMANPKSAATALQRIDLGDLTPGQGAVLCGIMQAAGYDDQARSLAGRIPDDTQMLPEEKQFLMMAKAPPRG